MGELEDYFTPASAILRYPDREENRDVMLIGGRPPGEFDIPVGDGHFDRFVIDTSPGDGLAFLWVART